MNRSDESRQVKPGLGRVSRPNRNGDEEETAQEGLGSSPDADEADDMKNTSATQGERPGKAYQGQDAEEASEARQKSGVMGGQGMKASGGAIKGQDISDSDEMDGPSKKVLHGRGKPPGHSPSVSGAHQGSGSGGEPSHFSNLQHGEREASISGAHQGQHGKSSDGGKVGSGFEAGGKLGKEHARGPSGAKR